MTDHDSPIPAGQSTAHTGNRRSTPNWRIFKAATTVGVLTAFVKGCALGKELIVAYYFGLGSEINAFYIAYIIPSFISTVVTNSLGSAIVPAYIRVKERDGKDAAHELIAAAATATLVLAVVLTGLTAAAVPITVPLVAPHLSPAEAVLVRDLLYLLLPTIALNVVATLWTATLTAEEHFSWGAASPAAIPIVSIVVVAIAARGRMAGFALAEGILLGTVLQCVLLALKLRQFGIGLLPRWKAWNPDLRDTLSQYLPATAGAVLMSGTTVVDQLMAATLPTHSVAALSYGNKLTTVAMGIGSLALGTAVLPHVSRMVAREQWAAVRHTVRVYGRLVLLVAVPVAIAAAVWSPAITAVFFQRGAFTATDSKIVSGIQAGYVLQVPAHLLGILFVRIISALRRNTILLWGSLLLFPINAALDYVFMRQLGVAGIALSTSVVYLVSCVYLGISLQRALRAMSSAVPCTALPVGAA